MRAATSCVLGLLVSLGVSSLGGGVGAGEVGWLEEYALSGEREKALGKLIPGTEEYYFYHCLHLQNEGRLEEVEPLLLSWIEKHGRTGGVVEVDGPDRLWNYVVVQAGDIIGFEVDAVESVSPIWRSGLPIIGAQR